MSVDSRHPLYRDNVVNWTQMRDTHRGSKIVKEKAVLYLPATSGMLDNGLLQPNTDGRRAYEAYKLRAHFPDVVNDAVEALLGVMHNKPPTIDLPSAMEPLREIATPRRESLEMLLRRINEEQLVTGRLGLLLDLPEVAPITQLPHIALYKAENIVNWDEGMPDPSTEESLNLVVLDETGFVRESDFEWKNETKYRVLVLGDIFANEPAGSGAMYRQGVFDENNLEFSEARLVDPSFRGRRIDFIPFTFVNTKDVVAAPDEPPLLGLSDLALTIYRGEADYRHSLFMQGQDTLVTSGAEDPEKHWKIGANAVINLPSNADAKFIGVESTGLAEQREALENDYTRAANKGGEMLDTVGREAESGDALRIRVSARTATLNQVALTGGFALQNALRQIARWMGANPEDVQVTPNLDFVDDTMAGKEVIDFVAARNMGAVLSHRSIHDQMRERGVTTMTFEEELAEIELEVPRDEDGGSTDPSGPEPDDEDEDEEEEETEDAEA